MLICAQGGSSKSNQYLDAISKAVKDEASPTEFNYEDRDSILYNLGVGAKNTDLKYVLSVKTQPKIAHNITLTHPSSEGADDFQVIPTFGVIPPFGAEVPYSFDEIVPNFSPMMLLHGEQYLEVRKFPIPTGARLLSRGRLLEVVDKGSAAVVKNGITTVLAGTGEEVFYNEMTIFLRGSGGFGGAKRGQDRGAATAPNKPPSRAPDVVVEEKTSEDQAAIYRLSGDYK